MRTLFLISCLLAATAPMLTPRPQAAAEARDSFPGWPKAFDSRPLRILPLSDREQGFLRDFPGKIGRSTDGEREIVMRWVDRPTRKLHPASHCFEGIGYSIQPRTSLATLDGKHWSCFEARRDGETLIVHERIEDSAGGAWMDVSSWYWAALLGRTNGPWWIWTVAENPR